MPKKKKQRKRRSFGVNSLKLNTRANLREFSAIANIKFLENEGMAI
jgi:hypothetical protein